MSSKRLIKEFKKLEKNSEISQIERVKENICHWTLLINGPEQSPYRGGKFRLDIRIPLNYPIEPPKIRFKTKIYHPNIHFGGEICLNIFKSQWNSNWSMENILLAIVSLLIDANPHDPINARAAFFYRENRQKFDEIAKIWTKNYAVKRFFK